jgi:transposase
MEGLQPLHRRVAGIDVHRMLHVVTLLVEQADGSIQRTTRQFAGFRRDCRALAAWLAEAGVELVVMESTGIYWKSVFAHLERAGIRAWVVNAHFIKHVPGHKTDMADSEWLAVLARFGLVRGSFIPPQDLRELRLVSRYRRKLSAMCASEVNRLHKILDDGGIKLGAVVSDINGVSARAMVKGLIEQQGVEQLLGMARGRLQLKREDLAASLDGDLSARHLFVLGHIHAHIEALQAELAAIDAYVLEAMQPYAWAHRLLQTIPGIDRTAAALILIEIGDDMGRFGCAERLAAWAALCPGNNESAGKCEVGPYAQGQRDHPLHPLRVRQRRAHDQEFARLQVPQPDGAQVAQEGNRGAGAQDDPADLRAAVAARGVHRPAHRLRGDQREEERAALDPTARADRQVARGEDAGRGRRDISTRR